MSARRAWRRTDVILPNTVLQTASAAVRARDGSLLQRLGRHAAAALVYMAVAIGLLSPMASHELLPYAPDHANHTALIMQARLAVAEGQFPIRVAPWEHERYRYPVYQFYSPLPYTIGAYVYAGLTPRQPFLAYKIVLWGALVLGGWFMYLIGWWLTRDRAAALLGGLVYMSAPYLMINVHARGAFTEAVAQGLLPVVLYCSLRACYGAWRSPWLFLAAAAWASLALTHNITYLYAGLYIGLLVAMITIGRRGIDSGLWRVGLAFGLGIAIAAYFLVPVLQASYLAAHDTFGSVYELHWLTPLASLLSPVSMPPEIPPGLHPTTENLNPSVGWPTLVSVGLFAVGYRRLPRRDAGPDVRRIGMALSVVFALAFVMTWSPVDFWVWLPKPALVVQFSYRLLTHVAWAGALLGVVALAAGPRHRRLDVRQAAAGIIVILMAHASFLPHHAAMGDKVTSLLARPRMGYGDGGYLVSSARLPPGTVRERRWDLPVIDDGVLRAEAAVTLPRAELRALGGVMLELEGHVASAGADPAVRPAPRTLLVFLDDAAPLRVPFDERGALVRQPLGDALAAGASPQMRLRFAIEPVQGDVAGATSPDPSADRASALRLTRVAVTGLPVDRPLQSVRETRSACGPDRDAVACRVTAAASGAIVELPVLYYPGMLEVQVDGRPAPAFMIWTLPYGLTGVTLAPGAHDVHIRFRGVAWANALSAAASLVTLAGVLCAVALAWRARAPRRQLVPSVHVE